MNRPVSDGAVHFLGMRRVTRTTACVLLALASVALVGGCAKPILSPDDDRSQFDRYDAVRNQYAPQYVFDEFGRRKPNLRARLLGKD